MSFGHVTCTYGFIIVSANMWLVYNGPAADFSVLARHVDKTPLTDLENLKN